MRIIINMAPHSNANAAARAVASKGVFGINSEYSKRIPHAFQLFLKREPWPGAQKFKMIC